MLNPNDFKEKQILFIDPKESDGQLGLRVQNTNLVLTRDGKAVNKISLHNILSVFVVGDMTITTKLIEAITKHGASIYFLKRNFLVYASFGANAEANYLARVRQYEMPKDKELELAKFLVVNKIKNQARLLNVQKTSRYKEAIQNAKNAQDFKSLLGVEGNFSSIFFKEYFKDIGWRRRAPRTREDIPNLLLDIGYTILFNFLDSILRLYGLDLYKGVYHRQFFARKSLVTDIQEPFRSIIDKALLKGYRLGIINENDFKFDRKKLEFVLPWKHASKYYKLFAEEIMERKMEIFDFILAFYRHIMMPEKNKLKEFNINKNYNK